jgi:POT family proton-dependent oligopeptide transporter
MWLIHRNEVMDWILLSLGLITVAYMIRISLDYDLVERQRMWVIILLLFFTTVFWSFFELAGSAINIFTLQNVNKNLWWGIQLTTSNFQAVNPLFIMVFAPFFSVMWVWLARRGWEPAAPVKFAIGLALLGAGFLVLNLGKAAAVDAMVPALFLILMYLLHTLGELALSPVGLSLVTKLAPARIAGLCMGFWFLSSAIAHQAGKWISRLTVVPEGSSREESLQKSIEVFNMVGMFALISAGILLALSPIIKRWMHGVR